MRRLDRAMFAIFLLALLADVAWSQVPAVVGGDSGGLILSAAGPLREGSGDAEFVIRRAYRSYRGFGHGFVPRAGFRSVPLASLTGSGWNARWNARWNVGWKRALSSRLSGDAARLVWTDLAFAPLGAFDLSDGSGSTPTASIESHSEIASLGVYEHAGSPAP